MYPDIDKNKIKKGLYIVSTPIGNLKDITLRALEVLKSSDFILCEDTRVSGKLLSKYKINNRLISNHKFNEKKNINKILSILKSEKIVSLISDAGTPTISDPGNILIKNCIDNNLDVFSIPGPSAVSSAVSISGFTDSYYFHGFLPEKKSQIEKDFKNISKINSSIVFFISAKKINKIINLIKKYFMGREILICREITKLYEENIRNLVDNLKEFETELKGEITVIISNEKIKKKSLTESDKQKIKKLLKKISIKDITKIFVEEKNVSKKEIYNYCLFLKNEN
jgi:16S rRNA (cytidine1402-2'-O)-methyltransferase|tara:strand:+ start:1728 stop:2576 length:849 start_codon:yes stop_codon:yes gene_type:complete